MIESLVGARLLSSDGDSVEIAHEALAVAWPRLRSWLDDDVEGLRIMRHLAVAADSWEELGPTRTASSTAGPPGQRAAVAHRGAPDPHPDQNATSSTPRPPSPRPRRAPPRNRSAENVAQPAAAPRTRRGRRPAGRGARGRHARAQDGAPAGPSSGRSRSRGPRRGRPPTGRGGAAAEDPDRPYCSPPPGPVWTTPIDTRTNLLATLDRAPALAGTAHSPGHILGLAVDTVANRVAVMAADGVGLELYDGSSLRRLPLSLDVTAGSVFADPGGHGYAMSVSGDLVGDGREPPVLLLTRTEPGPRSNSAASRPRLPGPRQLVRPAAAGTWATAQRSLAGRGPVYIQGSKPDLCRLGPESPEHPAACFELTDSRSARRSARDGRTLYTAT